MLFSKEVSQLASHSSSWGKLLVYIVTWKPTLSCGDLLFWWSRCQLDGESLRVRHIVHDLPESATGEVRVRLRVPNLIVRGRGDFWCKRTVVGVELVDSPTSE